MLGIPTHLAPRVNAWSLVRAFHLAAIGSFVMAAALLVAFDVCAPSVHTVSAVLVILPMIAMLALHIRSRSWRSAAAFLFVGAFCSCWFGFVVQREFRTLPELVPFLVSLVIVPLVLVGGAGVVPSRVIAWCVIGFVVGRGATLVGILWAGGSYRPAVIAWVTLIIVIGIVGFGSRMPARLRRVQPELLRSAREEHISAYRQSIELEATAILHDTVLSHLSAIALAPEGPMDEHLADAVEADFTMLVEREWLVPDARAVTVAAGGEQNDLERVVEDARAGGLTVDLTGDVDVVHRLDHDVLIALTRAVVQCLTNVRKHAGTDRAEVSVFDDGRSVTVMVIDEGSGFDERETGADRLGLKNSVRQRIARVGGDVQVWSSPGSGTSVMMSVPIGDEHRPGTEAGTVTVASGDGPGGRDHGAHVGSAP